MRARVQSVRRVGEHGAELVIAIDGSATSQTAAQLEQLLAQVRPGREVQLGGVVVQDSAPAAADTGVLPAGDTT